MLFVFAWNNSEKQQPLHIRSVVTQIRHRNNERKITETDHKVRHPRCVYNKLDWSLYTCLTQLYGGRDMYRINYIKINYMFRPFSLAIFKLIIEKLSKQLHRD